jgi:hypothetical protein
MKRSDIPDDHVVALARRWQADGGIGAWAALVDAGVPAKLATAKIEHLTACGLLDYGVSVRFPWPGPKAAHRGLLTTANLGWRPKPRTELGPVEVAFCAMLAEERRRQRLTVRELRDLSGVELNTISRLERKLSRPSLRHCAQLAEALGYTLPDFLATALGCPAAEKNEKDLSPGGSP